MKHPDVIAWENWSKSIEGQRCLLGEAKGQYLENRLQAAFYSGRRGLEEKNKQLKKRVRKFKRRENKILIKSKR